jgi:hypothetical protein
MPFVLAIPVVIEGVAVGGAWAYRGYQAYRAYRAAKALEAIITAQNNAKAEEEAAEKAKTDAQAKADAAASSNCKNCDEDPDCEKARENLKEALYGIRGEKKGVGRGLAERLCHWLHGTGDNERKGHLPALKDAADRVARARDWLTGKGDVPKNITDDPTMTKKEKKKLRENKLKNCSTPKELLSESSDLEKLAEEIGKGKSSIQPMPRADFAVACAKDALGLVNKAFGR